MAYETKDSGARAEFPGGYVRDTEEGKPRFDLLLLAGVAYEDQPLTRDAELMARGSSKYGERNWEKSLWPDGDVPVKAPEEQRFISSMLRHAVQAACGADDEDHLAAVSYNARALRAFRNAAARDRGEPVPTGESEGLWDPGAERWSSETGKDLCRGVLRVEHPGTTPMTLRCQLVENHERQYCSASLLLRNRQLYWWDSMVMVLPPTADPRTYEAQQGTEDEVTGVHSALTHRLWGGVDATELRWLDCYDVADGMTLGPTDLPSSVG